MQQDKIIYIDIDLIVPGKYQPRKNFSEESLNELAISIKQYGILNPILVTKKDDIYEIIAGERRYRAAKQAGLKEVPVIEKKLSDSLKAELALIENLHRENLTPIEEAKSYQEIMKLGNLTQQSLGEKLGKSQSAIANKIRLLSLPQNVQEALSNKKISERHARSLMTVKDLEEQTKLLNRVIENKMTVKELDNLINQESITEKEIKDAISDIMKSLNIASEEEKESDNMNDGNFFPNFNNTMGTNNNVSLNTMNIQSMASNPMPQMEETVMPTNPMLTQTIEPMMNQQPEMPQMVAQNQGVEMPAFGATPSFDVPLFNPEATINPEPIATAPIQESVVTPMPIIQDAPLFRGDFTAPVTPTIEPIVEFNPQPEETYVEEPVQNNFIDSSASLYTNPVETPVIEQQPEITPIQTPIEEPTMDYVAPPTYEIPVTVEPTKDKLTEVKALLEQNGINYKLYSNETNHCIIIEI